MFDFGEKAVCFCSHYIGLYFFQKLIKPAGPFFFFRAWQIKDAEQKYERCLANIMLCVFVSGRLYTKLKDTCTQ